VAILQLRMSDLTVQQDLAGLGVCTNEKAGSHNPTYPSHVTVWFLLEVPQGSWVPIHCQHPVLRRIENNRRAYQTFSSAAGCIVADHIFAPQIIDHSTCAMERLTKQEHKPESRPWQIALQGSCSPVLSPLGP